jgi:nitrogen fixation/metabolism regulation signal transduction histidine kinase
VGVTAPRALALAPIRETFQREVMVFGGILLISVALALFLARLLVDPVHQLEAAATALGKGDLSRRVNIDTGDEVERLGSAFDQMATQLTALYDEQRQSLRLREDFMQAAAHELKTPISTIRSSVHLLLSEPRAAPEQRTLEIIRRQARRMSLLVEDLLTVTRLGSGTPELHFHRVDLDRMCDEAVRRAAELSEKHTISWTSAGALEVDTDPELLSILLVRLLENAVGATPDGGPVEVAAWRHGAEALVSVADHGVGVPSIARPTSSSPSSRPSPRAAPATSGWSACACTCARGSSMPWGGGSGSRAPPSRARRSRSRCPCPTDRTCIPTHSGDVHDRSISSCTRRRRDVARRERPGQHHPLRQGRLGPCRSAAGPRASTASPPATPTPGARPRS